jgi:hypothetical protein
VDSKQQTQIRELNTKGVKGVGHQKMGRIRKEEKGRKEGSKLT